MLGGLIYLLIGALLTVALAILRRPNDDLQPGDEVFRYGRGALIAILLFIPLTTVGGFMFYMLNRPDMASPNGYLWFIFGLVILLWISLMYVYYNSYRITAAKDCIVISGLGRLRSIAYQDIKEVTLKDGAGRNGPLLEVFDARGKRFLAATYSFDYQGLSGAIRSRAAKYGVVYKHRDSWGKWS